MSVRPRLIDGVSEICPECLNDESNIVDWELVDETVQRSYECPDCRHMWTMLF